MALIAVAAPVHQSTEVAPTPAHSVSPVTVSNQLGGAAILGVLAVMVIAGLSSAGMLPKAAKRASVSDLHTHHPAH
jgi:hypothetical protein